MNVLQILFKTIISRNEMFSNKVPKFLKIRGDNIKHERFCNIKKTIFP